MLDQSEDICVARGQTIVAYAAGCPLKVNLLQHNRMQKELLSFNPAGPEDC